MKPARGIPSKGLAETFGTERLSVAGKKRIEGE